MANGQSAVRWLPLLGLLMVPALCPAVLPVGAGSQRVARRPGFLWHHYPQAWQYQEPLLQCLWDKRIRPPPPHSGVGVGRLLLMSRSGGSRSPPPHLLCLRGCPAEFRWQWCSSCLASSSVPLLAWSGCLPVIAHCGIPSCGHKQALLYQCGELVKLLYSCLLLS